MPAMIPCQREAFEVPDDVAYFNCAYMAPMLRSVRAAGDAALASVAQPWRVGAGDFFAPPERARGLFAQLIGASADDVAIVPSASYGVSTAAANLRLERGQVIVVLEEEFPSNVYPWHALAQRAGGSLRTVRRPASGDWAAAILEALDDRVAIAALSHCHWADGSLIELERVVPELARRGIKLALDVTQSLGVMPLDVKALGVDYLACAAYKWLLGPYSLGFLYVAPAHHAGAPLEHGWITRERSEDFAGLVDYRDGLQPGARRFDMGERASFVLMPMAIAALEQLLAWTPARTAATLARITGELATRAAALGHGVARLRAPHLLGLRVPGGVPAGFVERLRAQHIFVSVRGRSLRIAPHLHVTERDVARLSASLEELSR
jgi:selenocysteine lyase/cysteine desulfurase